MMGADLYLYIDPTRGLFVGSPGSLQPLRTLDLIQAENINVVAEFLQLTGNGLQPFVNIDATGWSLSFGLGYIDSTGAKQLIALASTSALTAISGVTGAAATALAFSLNIATSAASALLSTVYYSPIWAEASWIPVSATTAYANKVQIQGTIKTGFLGVGLPTPT